MTTIHDVARRAGVSPVTVSRVINGVNHVNTGTRQKVEQAIKDLGYVPNLAARSLRSRQTSTLALIVPDITNAFWTTVARGVEDAAQSEGYSVLLGNSDENLAKQTGYLNAVLKQRVDGVIIAPYDSDARNLSPLRDLKTPVVILDRLVQDWDVDTVRTDSISGAYALTQHLISLGHCRIAIITGPLVTSTSEERVAGYCLALKENGIPIDPLLIRRGEYRARSGKVLTDQLFEEKLNPTAIVAANNVMGMGVMESLQNHGKKVPHDVALVCFDELPDLSHFYPFLTVFVQPAYDMGINAAQLLLSRIAAHGPIQPRQVLLPGRLVLRYSCGRLLHQAGQETISLNPIKDLSEAILVKPLPAERLATLAQIPGLNLRIVSPSERESNCDRADKNRLKAALRFKNTDRLPHIEPVITSKAVLEYVLERSLLYNPVELSSGRQSITPEDSLEFAQRTGLDAVPCELAWLPGCVNAGPKDDLASLVRSVYPPPALAENLNRLEGFLRAAQGSRVGVYACLSSFFAPALRAVEVSDPRSEFAVRPAGLLRLMDMLLTHQEKVLRAVCDRFSADLEFILVRDDLFTWPGLGPHARLLLEEILPRLERLIAPAREHGLLVGISAPGITVGALASLHKAGFGLVHPLSADESEWKAASARWRGKMVFAYGVPGRLLISGSADEAEQQVHQQVKQIAEQSRQVGGFLIGTVDGIAGSVRPENFMAVAHAIHRSHSQE